MKTSTMKTVLQLPDDWSEENITLWCGTFDDALRKYRAFCCYRRGSQAIDYSAYGTASPFHLARVDPSDWRGSFYLLKRYLYSRRRSIFVFHHMLGLPRRKTMKFLGMTSGSVWNEEVEHVKCVIGQKLLDFHLWPLRDWDTGMGYFD